MKCPRCDSVPSPTARYCENCGRAVAGDPLARALEQAQRAELDGRPAEAVALYETLLGESAAAGVSAVLRKHLGNLHLRLGQLRSAREQLARACELDPHNGATWHDLGVVDYHLADFVGAIAALERAREADADLQLTLFWLGNARYHLGQLDAAARDFEALLERLPNFSIARFHLGVIHARRGDKQRAEAEFRKLLLQNPDDVAARYYISA